MATIRKTGDNGNFIYELIVTEKNQNITSNKSTVSITFKMLYNDYSTYWYSWGSYMKYTVTINGVKYTGNIPDRSETEKTSNMILINAKTQDVTHNSDGTKKINISFSVIDNTGTYYGCGNASNSGTLTLTTIPRTSSFKINDKTSAFDVNVEDSVEIKITRSSSDFSHKIQCYAPKDLKNSSGTKEYSTGWITIKTLSKDTVKYNYTIHPIWYNLFISTSKPELKFRVLTYSGSTKIGTSGELKINLTLNSSKTTPTISKCVIDYDNKDYCYGETSDKKKVLAPGTKTVSGKYSYTYPANYKKYRIYNNSNSKITLADKSDQTHNSVNINSDTISFTYNDGLGISRTYSKKNTEAIFYSKPSLKISELSYEYQELANGEYTIKKGQYTITGSAFGYINNDQIIIKHALSTSDSATLTSNSINIGDNGLNKNINKTYTFGELTLNSVSTPFYLLTSYQDGGKKSDEVKATKTYKIQPLFDWDDSNFQFNIPIIGTDATFNGTTTFNDQVNFKKDQQFSLKDKSGGLLNLNNSSITGANSIVFADWSDTAGEGLIFPNGSNFDLFSPHNGNIRFYANYDPSKTSNSAFWLGYSKDQTITLRQNHFYTCVRYDGYFRFLIPLNKPIFTTDYTDLFFTGGRLRIITSSGAILQGKNASKSGFLDFVFNENSKNGNIIINGTSHSTDTPKIGTFTGSLRCTADGIYVTIQESFNSSCEFVTSLNLGPHIAFFYNQNAVIKVGT